MMFSFIKQTYQTVTFSEKKFLFWIILTILFLTSIVSIYASLIEGDNFVYTGVDARAGSDKTVYFSQIEQARQGQILFKNLYTSEPQQARFFAPLWLVLGWLGKITVLANSAVFQLTRLVLGAFFLFLMYLFTAKVFKKIFYRKLSFIILSFSSGFGIFTLKRYISEEVMYEHFGTDLWVSEGNTFLTLAHSPLFILSQIFILLIFWWIIERLRTGSYLEAAGIGLFTLFLGSFHPYDLVTIYAVLGVWLIIECWREKKIIWPAVIKTAIIGAISCLAVIYFLWLFKSVPAIGGWASQNLTVSPRFLNYLFGYGLLFFTSAWALFRLAKSGNTYYRFLSVWLIVNWFLLFVPLQFQRRLSNGMHVPIALIGSIGLILIFNQANKKFSKLVKNTVCQSIVIPVIILSLFITNLFNIFLGVVVLSPKNYPQMITKPVYEAMVWIKNNLDADDIILADPIIGNIIPSITGGLVYIGHGHQTVDWETKRAKVVYWFFAGNKSDQKKQAWLKQEKIDYVFFSSVEDDLGSFEPGEKDYLKKVYDNGEVKIFKVKVK